MKKYALKTLSFFLLIVFVITVFPNAHAQSDASSASFRLRLVAHQETGAAGSTVSYPEFISDEPEDAALVSAINQQIQQNARIPEYLQLLKTVQEGSTGLQFTYSSSNHKKWIDEETLGGSQYVSLLFSAEGKMLKGRPSQVYYPINLDLATGNPVSFDELFTNPEGAKAFIEEYLEAEVEPTLSTYLENSQLFPVPYDRFFLDGFGNVMLVYEHDQLSFLSGTSGAVAFRYSELWDWLDTSPDGIPMQALWGLGNDFTAQYISNPGEKWNFPELLETNLRQGQLLGLPRHLIPDLGTPLDEVLSVLHPASDSGFYADGAYYEVEEPRLRGTYLLTDKEETTLTGILSSRLDCFGIETGKTTLAEAIALMGREPDGMLPIDETAAEMYLVCPGTIAMYSYTDAQKQIVEFEFTLYADEDGIVQFIEIELI